jgi:hypothetical protein
MHKLFKIAYYLLASKAPIFTWFYWLCTQTISLEFYKTIVFTKLVSSYPPLNPSLISNHDSMFKSLKFHSKLIYYKVRELFSISPP